jgi:hypothetical protein
VWAKDAGPSLDQIESILTAARDPRRVQFAVLAFTEMRSGLLYLFACYSAALGLIAPINRGSLIGRDERQPQAVPDAMPSEARNLDKTGTTAILRNEAGPQVLCF